MTAGTPVAPPSADVDSDVRSLTRLGRVNAGLVIAELAGFIPFLGAGTVLMPARAAVIDPAGKVGIVAALAATAALLGFFTNFFIGAASDRTRSRFGRRNPWILAGGAGLAASLVLLAFAVTLPLLVAAWCLLSIALGLVLAPAAVIIPDRVPDRHKGVASSFLGGGLLVGATIGVLVSTNFVADPSTGFLVLAPIPLALVVLFQVVAPEHPSRDLVFAERFSVRALFQFPRSTPDFYWALVARLLVMLGYYAYGSYQLFIATDYVGVNKPAAAGILGLGAILNLVGALLGSAIGGPVSDRLGRRKVITIVASTVMAVGVLIPAIGASPALFLLYFGVAGLGLGMFLSVDGALMAQLLPSVTSRGRDIGILNLPNNAGQLLGPVVGAGILGLGLGYVPVFIAAAVLCVAGTLLLLPIRSVR